MTERSHGWTLAQLEVVRVFCPFFDVNQWLCIEIVSAIERGIKLVNGWWKEIDRPDIKLTSDLSKVLGHLVGIDLTNESLHGSKLILGRVAVRNSEINFDNHVLILSSVSDFVGLTSSTSSQLLGVDLQVNITFLGFRS